MKFGKFVKSLGVDGIVYVSRSDERWLSDGVVYARVPDDITTVTATDEVDLIPAVQKLLEIAPLSSPCKLVRAEMPVPDGKIKDCVRVFSTENEMEISVTNDAYSLIERGDVVELIYGEPFSALLIKRPTPIEDEEIVGVILGIKN